MGRIRDAWRRITGSVPTNYGYGYLEGGTYFTFLRQPDGKLIVQTPLSLFGREIVKLADGRYALVVPLP